MLPGHDNEWMCRKGRKMAVCLCILMARNVLTIADGFGIISERLRERPKTAGFDRKNGKKIEKSEKSS